MIALVLCLVAAAPEAPKAVDPQLKITLFADAPDIVTPTGIAVDPKGRVLAIESHTHFRPEGYTGPPADRIRAFEDTDGDGRADRITTVFEGTKHTMALAFHPDGGLYVASRNEVFRLDLDASGKATTPRKTLVRLETPGNYPHNGLSGVCFDFDGTVYFGLGENLGADYALIGTDGTRLQGGGEGGNIYRCRPDGSKLARVATGFWNPFAMTFDAFGRLFAVDNDPDSRPPCRLLNIVDGGDYGYRFRNGRKGLHPFTSWNGELPGTLPMVAGTGEAPSGIVAYESDGFPSFRGDLLVTSWGDHRIDRFRLKDDPQNTTLAASVRPIVTGGESFRPVGIAVAPDGSLFVTDWADKSYELHGKGRIWHISAANRPERTDPSAGVMHPDRAIRDRAARTLGESGDAGQGRLRDLLADPKGDARAQVSALHGLVLSGKAGGDVLRAARSANKPEVEAEAMRTLPEATVLGGEGPRSAAATAAWHRRGGIERNLRGRSADPFLDQAARVPLARQDARSLIGLFRASREPNARLQIVLALRDSTDPSAREVLPAALGDSDPDIRFVAIQWIGEQGLAGHREDLLRSLGAGSITNRLFEGTLAAIDRLDGGKTQANDEAGGEALVSRFATDPNALASVRRLALRVLRPDHPALTTAVLDDLLRSSDAALRIEAVRLLRDSPIPDRRARLLRIAADREEPSTVRAEAVAGLSGATEEERSTLVALASGPDRAVRLQALRSLRDVPLSSEQKEILSRVPNEVSDPALAFLKGGPLSEASSAHDLLRVKEFRRAVPADPEEGERVFFHPKGAGCYRCHRLDGRGGRVGPDLTATGPQTDLEKLVDSIVLPDREIAPQFTTWSVARHDGTLVQGVLVEEAVNGDQTYADAEGRAHVVKGADLAERKPLTTSIMPKGLGGKLTTRELSDLLAFIRREGGEPGHDNVLTAEEKAAGWSLLFDGRTLDGWMTSSKTPSKVPVRDGAINPHGCGGYMMIHEKVWGDFDLSLDFKISPRCNSGVFVRTFPLEPRPGKDVGFNGLEIAIDDTKDADLHDTGAIYDLVKPSKNAMKPAGEWNHLEITCDGPRVVVRVNGERVSSMNLDEWTEPNKRPDGSGHKFDVAYKDHPRSGYIGLQDHGSDCWYKNIKIRKRH